jgi:hypothetical protein
VSLQTTGTISNAPSVQSLGDVPGNLSGVPYQSVTPAAAATSAASSPAAAALIDPGLVTKILLGSLAVLIVVVGAWALIGPDVESAAGTVAKAAA